MKESYRKDVANHPDPESCGTGRKARHEALTGADAGVVSNREIPNPGTPTLLSEAEGNMAACDKASTTTDRRGRRPTARIETSGAGTGRSHSPPTGSDGPLERPAKAKGQAVGMYGHGKSDEPIVSKKPANKISKHHLEFAEAELAEIRGSVKRNTDQPGIPRTQSRINEMSPGLERVRQNARKDKKMKFTALLHHVNEESLTRAFHRLHPKAAPGIDGVVWQQYRVNLTGNLQRLCQQVHRGSFRAKPSRRVYIPKPDGRLRPLGIAALEDKIVQAAVVEVLNAIYETDFLGFSYGFHPGRGAHDALDALAVGVHRRKLNWVLDADIRGFFDNISHEWMLKFLQHRIADRRLLRLVSKWLRRSHRARPMEGHRSGNPARGNTIAVTGQYLSPLRLGHLGTSLAPASRARRGSPGAVCG